MSAVRTVKQALATVVPRNSMLWRRLKHLYFWLYHLSPDIADFRQRRYLEKFAGQNGDIFFVQIGASDGKRHDPIFDLVRRHYWQGILVEPLTTMYDRLVKNYQGVGGLVFERAAIAWPAGERTLYHVDFDPETMPDWADQLGSFNLEVLLGHRSVIPEIDKHIVEETVTCVTFDDLVAKHEVAHIDILVIDTEGYDFEIIRRIDFAAMKPRVIYFESRHLPSPVREQCMTLLRGAGYRVIWGRDNSLAALT